VEVRRLTSFERFICGRENVVLIFSFLMKCKCFGDTISSRVEDKLKTISLSSSLSRRKLQ